METSIGHGLASTSWVRSHLIILFLFGALLYLIRNRYGSSLRNIPGPQIASITRLWKLYKILAGDFEWTNIQLHQKYGPIVRIAPNEVSIDDPDESLRIIYGHGTKFTKSRWYEASDAPGHHSIFTDANIERHACERRVVANSFSMTSLIEMEPFVSTCVDIFEQRLKGFAQTQEEIDLGHWLQCYAFDTIGEITFGKRFGFLDRGQDIGHIMEILDGFMSYSAWMGVIPELHAPYTRLMSALSGNSVPLESLRNFASAAIEERQKKGSAHKDFVSQFLRIHEAKAEQFPMSEVYKMCMVLTGAGSDTTAIALRAVMYFLIKNPPKLQKLREEIVKMEKQSSLSDPATYAEVCKMPYLQAVLKEAMRLHPSTGFTMARTVPAGGVELLGHKLPQGTVVGINSWVAHRNQDVFGKDIEAFLPERWLASEDATTKMNRYFLEFGMGSRTCLGKNISLMEMSKLIPQLVRHFDFDFVNPRAAWDTKNWWLVKQTGLRFRVSSRNK